MLSFCWICFSTCLPPRISEYCRIVYPYHILDCFKKCPSDAKKWFPSEQCRYIRKNNYLPPFCHTGKRYRTFWVKASYTSVDGLATDIPGLLGESQIYSLYKYVGLVTTVSDFWLVSITCGYLSNRRHGLCSGWQIETLIFFSDMCTIVLILGFLKVIYLGFQ